MLGGPFLARSRAAAGFYGELFDWEAEDQMPPDASGHYFMCRLRGRDIAAMGSQQAEGAQPMWNTYVAVKDADASAAKVREAGGTVFGEPFDVFGAGRMAVATDPAARPSTAAPSAGAIR